MSKMNTFFENEYLYYYQLQTLIMVMKNGKIHAKSPRIADLEVENGDYRQENNV